MRLHPKLTSSGLTSLERSALRAGDWVGTKIPRAALRYHQFLGRVEGRVWRPAGSQEYVDEYGHEAEMTQTGDYGVMKV